MGIENGMYHIKTRYNNTICTPADINIMTVFVLLEQEAWFEQEVFLVRSFLKSGMTALDIGSSFGVYAVSMARQAGPAGRVYAFEPASEFQQCLTKSQEVNFLNNLEIICHGLSNKPGKAAMQLGRTPELNIVLPDQSGDIELMTLDDWWQEKGRPSIDLIKLDVNGMEARVLSGALLCLSKTSPLVVFPIDQNHLLESPAAQVLLNAGFHVYYYLPSPQVLVPFDKDKAPAPSLTNLVAIKPEQAGSLQRQGLLSSRKEVSVNPVFGKWREYIFQLPWASYFCDDWLKNDTHPKYRSYIQALDCICLAQLAETISVNKPFLFNKAAEILEEMHQLFPDSGSIAFTLTRAMNILGHKSKAVLVLQNMQAGLQWNFDLPFLPPLESFDHKPIHTNARNWINICCMESIISLGSLSSYFSAEQDLELLHKMHENPEQRIEFLRRLALIVLKSGGTIQIDDNSPLLQDTSDNLNSRFWIDHVQGDYNDDVENAEAAFMNGNMTQSVQAWTELITKKGRFAPEIAFLRLAMSYNKLRQFDSASDVIQKGMELHPESKSLWQFSCVNQWTQSGVACFEKKGDFNNGLASLDRAYEKLFDNQYNEAKRCFRKSLDLLGLNPGWEDALRILFLYLQKEKNFGSATDVKAFPLRKILAGGNIYSGSGALYDYFSEFSNVIPVPGMEIQYFEGKHGLIDLLGCSDNIKRYKTALFNFFKYHIFGLFFPDDWGESRIISTNTLFRDCVDSEVYMRSSLRLLESLCVNKPDAKVINPAVNCFFDDLLLTLPGASRDKVFLFDNIIHVYNIELVSLLKNYVHFSVFRDPRPQQVDQIINHSIYEISKFIKTYRVSREKFDYLKEVVALNGQVAEVCFENFILDENYRESIAEYLNLDLLNQKKHKHFKPWESVSQVFLHEKKGIKEELKLLENELGEYFLDFDKLKRNYNISKYDFLDD